jgi:hypothetical protein
VTLRVGCGADSVNGHRAVAARLEVLLAERLELDRVLPAERAGDVYRLGRWVSLGAAVVPERAAGEGGTYFDLLLVDATGFRG